jgi:hypothetical protein
MKAGYYLGLILAIVVLPVDLCAATPMETIKTEVDKIVEMLRNPDFKSQPKDTQIAKISKIINKVIDYKELSKRAVARFWRIFLFFVQKIGEAAVTG